MDNTRIYRTGRNFWEHILSPDKVKRLSYEDLPDLIKLTNNDVARRIFGEYSLEDCMYTSWTILGIYNNDNDIAGLMVLGGAPNLQWLPPSEWEHWVKRLYNLPRANGVNTYWIHLLLWDQKYYLFFVKPMVQYLFQNNFDLEYVIMIIPPRTYRTDFLSLGTRIKPRNLDNVKQTQDLYVFSRAMFATDYKVRKIVEEDNDDIIELLDLYAPHMSHKYGQYYLHDLINSGRDLVVAENYGSSDVIAACCINGTVNYDLLNEEFNLVPFNGLRKPADGDNYYLHLEEDILMHSSGFKELEDFQELIVSGEVVPHFDPQFDNYKELLNQISKSESEDYLLVFTSDSLYYFQDDMDDDLEPINDYIEDSPPVDDMYGFRDSKYWEENERFSHGSIYKDWADVLPTYKGKDNAFVLEIAVAVPKHEDALLKLFQTLFQYYPHRDYCVMMVPSTEKINDLDKYFTKVVHRAESSTPYELYVMHKSSIFGHMHADFVTRDDISEIKSFLATVPKSSPVINKIVEFVKDLESPYIAVMLTCDKAVVGVAVLSEDQDTAYLRQRYDIYHVNFFGAREGSIGQLDHLILSPIFQRYANFFLREIHQISNFDTLFYRHKISDNIDASREAPTCNVLDDLIPLKPVYQPEYDMRKLLNDGYMVEEYLLEERDPFSLFLSTIATRSMETVIINEKIVVVGPSNGALAFLTTLLTGKWITYKMKFTNVTAIWEESLGHNRIGTRIREAFLVKKYFLDVKYLDMLNLKTYVNVVTGKISDINRKEQIVILEHSRYLAYDLLFFMSGEKFKYPTEMPSTENPENFFIVNNMLDVAKSIIKLKKYFNKQKQTDAVVIVYGHFLQALCILNGLLTVGVPGERIVFIEPFPYKMSIERKHRHNISMFNEPNVEELVYDAIKSEKVTIYSSYYFIDWNYDENGSFITSAKFESLHKMLEINCAAMYYFSDKRISARTYKLLNQSGLVYDGRLVINNKSQTNDPKIYAAGSLTKYSRRYYASSYIQKYYNGVEVGEKLGQQIKESLVPKHLLKKPKELGYLFQVNEKINLVPKYEQPHMKSCKLPGGLYYFSLTKPGIKVPLETALSGVDYGQVLITGSAKVLDHQGYFRLHINPQNRIETITCLAKFPIDTHNLTCIWGQNEALVNNLVMKFEMGQIKDLFEYFQEPWAYALYHYKFNEIQEEMNMLMTSIVQGHGDSIAEMAFEKYKERKWQSLTDEDIEELETTFKSMFYPKILEQQILKFIRSNSDTLPTVYAHPHVIKALLQNCLDSPFFY